MRLHHVLLAAMGLVILAALFFPCLVWLLSLDPGEAFKPLDYKEWIAIYALLAAVFGWLIAAWVQVRNSLKQHTVNTMLQSRLSTAFQDKAGKFQKSFPTLPVVVKIKAGDWLNNETAMCESIEAARYMLNYYEFIAVGIRNGDFDEALMRQSWRRIVCTLHEQTDEFVKFLRGESADGHVKYPKTYEHLYWLVERWKSN